MPERESGRTICLIICAAGPAGLAWRLVDEARHRGYSIFAVPTPSAMDFIDVELLERKTGHPVWSEYRKPGDSRTRTLPGVDAIVVAPASYNTINKWANGTSDTYALGLLAESFGLNIPVVVLPFVNQALASHFAFRRSVRELRDAGATIILGPGQWEPHPAGTGGARFDSFPWAATLNEVDRVLGHSATRA